MTCPLFCISRHFVFFPTFVHPSAIHAPSPLSTYHLPGIVPPPPLFQLSPPFYNQSEEGSWPFACYPQLSNCLKFTNFRLLSNKPLSSSPSLPWAQPGCAFTIPPPLSTPPTSPTSFPPASQFSTMLFSSHRLLSPFLLPLSTHLLINPNLPLAFIYLSLLPHLPSSFLPSTKIGDPKRHLSVFSRDTARSVELLQHLASFGHWNVDKNIALLASKHVL